MSGIVAGTIAASLNGTALVAEEGAKLPAPPIVIGLGVFVLLLILLGVTLAIGKGRPHA